MGINRRKFRRETWILSRQNKAKCTSVNFINILRAHFLYECAFFAKTNREKLRKALAFFGAKI